MGSRRAIVLQAGAVAAIAAVIFIAFLRPSEPGELSGIEAPGGSSNALNPPSDQPRNGGKNNGRPQSGPRDQDRSNRNEGSTGNNRAEGPVVDGEAQGGASTAQPLPSSGGEAPQDLQYRDLVTRLMEQVGRPALFREIDR